MQAILVVKIRPALNLPMCRLLPSDQPIHSRLTVRMKFESNSKAFDLLSLE